MRNKSTGSGCGTAFVLVWLFGWSALTLTFDGFVARSLAKQLHSRAYSSTFGTIAKSAVEIHHDSDGYSYGLDLEYSYVVGGVGYSGTRYRYGFETSGEHDVEAIVERLPVDSRTKVFYNPSDPEDSLLAPGIGWFDLFIPLFLLPFNLVMVGMFSLTLGAKLRRRFRRPPVAIKIRQHDLMWSARVYQVIPMFAAGGTALGVSFISIFVVGFGQLLAPGWWLVVPAWCCVLGFSVAAYLCTKPSTRMEIDGFRRRITLYLRKRIEPVTLDFSRIESIEATSKSVVLGVERGKSIQILCGSERNAEWFRNWLQERLGAYE